ncbi:hypothetical protein V3W47_03185 [Deinococcus sp. YIM 134068]|uniref:hypothetical protein n=1 Tax=Deinococcus lichenicola TaxID=3118910 RepID=UPI002F94A489
MRRTTRTLALTAGLAFLAGCSQSPSPVVGAAMTRDDALKIETLAQQSMGYLAAIFRFQGDTGSLGAGVLLGADARASARVPGHQLTPADLSTCLSEEGTFVDADGDTFPASNVATILNECSFTYGTVSLDVSGQYARDDQDDTKVFPESGYRLGIGGVTGTGGANFSLAVNGSVIASGSTALNYEIERQSQTVFQTTFGFLLARTDISVDSFASKDTAYTYTADSAANPFAGGVLSGSSTIGFQPYPSNPALVLNFAFDDLRYDATCAVGFRSGSVLYSDNAGNNVTLTYNCDSYTATFNGSGL